jgi:hypothetical protein
MKVKSANFEGVEGSDYPDFCDAYIIEAYWEDGSELTEAEIEAIDDVTRYELLMDYLY